MSQYMTAQEMAGLLRCSIWTVYERAKRGLLPSVRPAGARGRLLFDRAEVEAALRGENRQAMSEAKV
jgi:excisionase family DNA binding protein